MKDLDHVLVFLNLIVNDNRTVHQFPHARPMSDRTAHAWKLTEQNHVIELGFAEARGRAGVVLSNVADKRGQIG
jgi:hypothetical protein